jgi:hypothetical protein
MIAETIHEQDQQLNKENELSTKNGNGDRENEKAKKS